MGLIEKEEPNRKIRDRWRKKSPIEEPNRRA